jgi:hypothetical protein
MQEKPPAQSASSGSGGVIFPFSFHVFTPGNLNIYSKQFSEMNKIEKVFSLLLLFLLFPLNSVAMLRIPPPPELYALFLYRI